MPRERMIDANALLERMKKDPLFPFVEEYGISRVIEAEPTVEAIPIEWIETYMNRFTSSTQWAFKGMIQDWERKEE